MEWQIEYSIRNNAYLKRRFIKGLIIALIIVYGILGLIIMFNRQTILSDGFISSGIGIIFWLASTFFWLIVLFLWLFQMTTYIAHFTMTQKEVRVRTKAKKNRKKWLGFLDFINASTYRTHPGNVSIHSVGSQGKFKITWRNTKYVRVYERLQTVIIKGRPGESMPLYYDQAQKDAIIDYLKTVFPKTQIV